MLLEQFTTLLWKLKYSKKMLDESDQQKQCFRKYEKANESAKDVEISTHVRNGERIDMSY